MVTEESVHLYLASRSPRRRALLEQLGVSWEPVDGQVDEEVRPGESPARYVRRLALAKARAGLEALVGQGRGRTPARAVVLGADTAVVLDGEVLGKAADAAGMEAHLRRLSGREHLVLSAVAVLTRAPMEGGGPGGETGPGGGAPGAEEVEARVRVARTAVWFRELAGAEIRRYVESGEPRGKAGSYAIQGAGGAFVRRLEGSWSNVVGLPLEDTRVLLTRAGVLAAPSPVAS